MLQTSDHLYYMCTKWFSDGDVHRYFNPYESPYEAYINYMNIIDDLSQRVKNERGHDAASCPRCQVYERGQISNLSPQNGGLKEKSHDRGAGILSFEVSWEVCNKVGGIYTVITSKLPEATKLFGERYFVLGPDLKTNPDFEETDEECWNRVREGWPSRRFPAASAAGRCPADRKRSSSASVKSTTRSSSSSEYGRTTASTPSPGAGTMWSRSCSAMRRAR